MLNIIIELINFVFSVLDYLVNLAGYLALFVGIRGKISDYKKRKHKEDDQTSDGQE